MLEHLFAFLAQVWGMLVPMVIIDVYDNAGVLRRGKYHRTLTPGLHWKIPVLESVHHETIALQTIRLPPQTCTTSDGVGVVVGLVVRFHLVNIEPYICGVFDQKDVLIDVSMGAVLKNVRETSFEDLLSSPPESRIASTIRRQVSKFGFDIDSATFTDIGKVRSLRLISNNPHHSIHSDIV